MTTVVFFNSAEDAAWFMLGFIVFVGVCCVITVLLNALFCDTRSLPQKFNELGNLVGMPLHEIITKIGRPQEMARDMNGDLICGWYNDTYLIALGFVDNKCVRIISEQTFAP